MDLPKTGKKKTKKQVVSAALVVGQHILFAAALAAIVATLGIYCYAFSLKML